jgi:hypothetical protein
VRGVEDDLAFLLVNDLDLPDFLLEDLVDLLREWVLHALDILQPFASAHSVLNLLLDDEHIQDLLDFLRVLLILVLKQFSHVFCFLHLQDFEVLLDDLNQESRLEFGLQILVNAIIIPFKHTHDRKEDFVVQVM